jgi:hypothetical protein
MEPWLACSIVVVLLLHLRSGVLHAALGSGWRRLHEMSCWEVKHCDMARLLLPTCLNVWKRRRRKKERH